MWKVFNSLFIVKSCLFVTPANPLITIIEPELTVLQYDEIFLSCNAKSFSEMTVKWTKAGVVLKEKVAR
jgi:hypothetical protein